MSDFIKKKVDESWKDEVKKEKDVEEKKTEKTEEQIQEEMKNAFAQASFTTFVSSLGMQVLVFLGHIPNPMTNKEEKDLNQAKYLIDTLNILQDKTKGNLDKQEEEFLKALLYDIRVKFVEVSNKAE